MRQLGRRIGTVTDERLATEFLLQRLSVAIQRGNAATVLCTNVLAVDEVDTVFYV